ncbi:hypothetical protein KC887_01335 [Candidatus Kaiserbacteria bacterium]|nr:hypothetical protein [Candidatus Kaiserbacteria bacterium]
MQTKTIVNYMQWVEAPPQVVGDVTELAMIEAGRVLRSSLAHFELLDQVGRVVLVSICPESDTTADPIVPLVLKKSVALREVARDLIAAMVNSYHARVMASAAYVAAAKNHLDGNELAYLERQLELCTVDPMRRWAKAK